MFIDTTTPDNKANVQEWFDQITDPNDQAKLRNFLAQNPIIDSSNLQQMSALASASPTASYEGKCKFSS